MCFYCKWLFTKSLFCWQIILLTNSNQVQLYLLLENCSYFYITFCNMNEIIGTCIPSRKHRTIAMSINRMLNGKKSSKSGFYQENPWTKMAESYNVNFVLLSIWWLACSRLSQWLAILFEMRVLKILHEDMSNLEVSKHLLTYVNVFPIWVIWSNLSMRQVFLHLDFFFLVLFHLFVDHFCSVWWNWLWLPIFDDACTISVPTHRKPITFNTCRI